MTRVPKFSIVTPSYNQAGYIGATIESVLSQEGDFEIEYFVMDGGSTDGSVEIIKSYADKLMNAKWSVRCAGISMQWVSQRDKGQSDAINQGLHRATGDIVSYINSDDLYCPGACEQVAREFAARPEADFIYGDGDVIDAAGNVQWEWLSRPYDQSVMTSYHFLWNDFSNYIMQQATFWRTRVMQRIGYFDDAFHYALDTEYWIRAGHAGLNLVHIPYKLGKFRMIQGTKSLSEPTAFWPDQLEIFRRYRGSHTLGIFFAYYFYNLAMQFGLDVERAREAGQAVFDRWKVLPDAEQLTIARQASRGFDLACLLVANELRRQEQYKRAQTTFKRGLAQRPFLILHPFALSYLLKRSVGTRLSSVLDNWTRRLIHWYRARRFDYRYR